ncbi:MAG TPA: DoxX family protein [Candidatus Acidoferrum sp.]|nr:DoxX family protein [Candidatus Acidoferrum sp.]
MVVLFILIISCLIFRGIGFAGVPAFASWQASARDALSLMLIFTGISHFTFMKEDLARMMPPSIPWPRGMVYFTGICELAGAIGLQFPEFRVAAAYALVAFFVAVLPANIHAARAGVTLRGKPATNLWLRIPMQLLFIAIAVWSVH